MRKTHLLVFCLFFGHLSTAQTTLAGKDIVGIWKTIDDEEGKTKSHVQIIKKGDKYIGKIVKLIDPQILKDAGKERFEDVLCDECPKEHGKDKPLLGLEMLWGMEKKSDKYDDGEIMDPKNGKVYDCTLWLDENDKTGNTLKVRGYILFLYRTQTWYRVE
jgi:uncharacterized protein (DUF2147 family)